MLAVLIGSGSVAWGVPHSGISDTVDAPRNLSVTWVARLQEIANVHGGRIPFAWTSSEMLSPVLWLAEGSDASSNALAKVSVKSEAQVIALSEARLTSDSERDVRLDAGQLDQTAKFDRLTDSCLDPRGMGGSRGRVQRCCHPSFWLAEGSDASSNALAKVSVKSDAQVIALSEARLTGDRERDVRLDAGSLTTQRTSLATQDAL